jgi:hypothetical protein
MPKLKFITLEDKTIELESEGYQYFIKNEEDWIALTSYKEAYLLVSYPSGYVSTSINQKFINNQFYKLINDLNFEGKMLKSWMYFGGTLDGNNKTISNIYLNDDDNNGLFGISFHCIIKNLNILNCTINNNVPNNGCLIGQINSGDFRNIKIGGNINISGNYAGIIASNFNGEIDNFRIDISSNKNSLFNSFKGIFKNSFVNINTSSENNNPLFCKYLNGTINNCYFINNKEDVILKSNIDGLISNTIFNYNIDKKIDTNDKTYLYNCIINTNNDTIIFNKSGEIINEIENSNFDEQYWKDGELKSFPK